jgi:hypothetical protein
MKGRATDRLALSAVVTADERPDCWTGAKAVAEPMRARAASFIMVTVNKGKREGTTEYFLDLAEGCRQVVDTANSQRCLGKIAGST